MRTYTMQEMTAQLEFTAKRSHMTVKEIMLKRARQAHALQLTVENNARKGISTGLITVYQGNNGLTH